MNGPWHYQEAERLAAKAADHLNHGRLLLATECRELAAIHVGLAQAAAAVVGPCGMGENTLGAWSRLTAVTTPDAKAQRDTGTLPGPTA